MTSKQKIKECEIITMSNLATEKEIESAINSLKKRFKGGTISKGVTAEDFIRNTFTLLIEVFRHKGYYAHMKRYKKGRSARLKKGNKHRYKKF